MTDKSFYRTEPYREARAKAEKDLDNWPDNRKRNRDVLGILCAGLSIAIVILWVGIWYGSISKSTDTPQAQTVIH